MNKSSEVEELKNARPPSHLTPKGSNSYASSNYNSLRGCYIYNAEIKWMTFNILIIIIQVG